MNPGDVAQSALPLASSDLSLFALFWQAHWLVKAVMLGLMINVLAAGLLSLLLPTTRAPRTRPIQLGKLSE